MSCVILGDSYSGRTGANKSEGSEQSITAAKPIGIVYSSDNHTLTANGTTNIGGIIANIQTDENGNDVSHDVNFTTNTLVTEDLVNTHVKDQRNLGGSIGVGTGKLDKSINNVGVQIGHTANDFESMTKATVGDGVIVTSDALTGQDSLANVNRDPFNTEIIIKDQQTAGGAPFVLKNGQYEQIQLHHSRQDGRGALFEISKSTHLNHNNQDGRQALHPYGNEGHPDYAVERDTFKIDKTQYWKDRLNQL